jgi:menaquinone-dependent protoporphyrinogen IX oxidase
MENFELDKRKFEEALYDPPEGLKTRELVEIYKSDVKLKNRFQNIINLNYLSQKMKVGSEIYKMEAMKEFNILLKRYTEILQSANEELVSLNLIKKTYGELKKIQEAISENDNDKLNKIGKKIEKLGENFESEKYKLYRLWIKENKFEAYRDKEEIIEYVKNLDIEN